MGTVACIPARGGSKRIPHKNIRDFQGRPLIDYSIKAALDCGVFDRVIVSTDDEEIAKVARECGAEIPFMRDAFLADGYTGTFPVTVDAVHQLEKLGYSVDCICCIYATAPLLRGKYLKEAYDLFIERGVDSVQSVCEFSYPIQRALITNDQGMLVYREPEYAPSRSQDLPKCYQDCGQFYFYSKHAIEHGSSGTLPYIMPRYRVIDIDTPEDWEYACILARAIQEMNLE